MRLTFPIVCSFRFTLQQQNVVLLVVPTLRIFPVDVKAVEVSVAQIRYCAVDEGLSGVSRRRHVLELLRAEGPTTWSGARQKRIVFYFDEIISNKNARRQSRTRDFVR